MLRQSARRGPSADTGSSLSVLIRATWLVMKKRDVQNFGRILDFLELTQEQVPDLLCYRHHAKLSTGLRGKIVLHMMEEKKPLLDVLTALNSHFPPVFPDDSEARNVFKVRQCKINFRKLVLRMIRDEKLRQHYVENTLQLEYGDAFMAALEKLLWEFLHRLQTVHNHQVPETTKQPVLVEDRRSSTPIRPSSELNFLATNEARYRTKPSTNADRSEENLSSDQAESENYRRSKQGYGGLEGIRLSSSQGREREPVCRRTLDLINSPPDRDEPLPPYFAVFGFDCSENSKVNDGENLSPPDPLQSQSLDLGPECGPDQWASHDVTGHGVFTDMQGTEVAQAMNRSPGSDHEYGSMCEESRGNREGLEKSSAQGLTSWRYQPRVRLTRLPLTIINKYPRDATPEDLPAQVADSEPSQSQTSTTWFWVCSDSTDNDSNDPDYFPGYSLFQHDGEEMSRIQPKRGLRLSSPP
ncbi:TERF1-interacting nuclear factor 2 isoform X2 [Ranitomeya variabilis]|uniref:TERF1-interacting nuclear factor 2 isoform X2 n=1 Tax=Ranitomeya variabilis TaxID=490064 RepID=UPI004057880C